MYITIDFGRLIDADLAAATSYTVCMYDCLLHVNWVRAGLVVILKKRLIRNKQHMVEVQQHNYYLLQCRFLYQAAF